MPKSTIDGDSLTSKVECDLFLQVVRWVSKMRDVWLVGVRTWTQNVVN